MTQQVSPGDITGQQHAASMRRVVVACFIGNLVEWFDYAVYGYLAATIATAFFPQTSPTAGMLATFGIFAVSFLVRPLGGVFWGQFGDRVGRRAALSWSILIMSGATFVIALLPDYSQIGLAAPALLLLTRIVQGFSAAGEYAGASTFLYEYAPTNRRGFYTSVVPASTATGLLLGLLVVTLMTTSLAPESMSSWGWRLPFLLAAPLGLIGRHIRLKLEDTPQYRAMADAEPRGNRPVRGDIPHPHQRESGRTGRIPRRGGTRRGPVHARVAHAPERVRTSRLILLSGADDHTNRSRADP